MIDIWYSVVDVRPTGISRDLISYLVMLYRTCAAAIFFSRLVLGASYHQFAEGLGLGFS